MASTWWFVYSVQLTWSGYSPYTRGRTLCGTDSHRSIEVHFTTKYRNILFNLISVEGFCIRECFWTYEKCVFVCKQWTRQFWVSNEINDACLFETTAWRNKTALIVQQIIPPNYDKIQIFFNLERKTPVFRVSNCML